MPRPTRGTAHLTPLRGSHLAYTIGERHGSLEIATLKSRIASTPVVRRKIAERPETPGRKATPERTVRHQRNPKFSESREKFVLRIAAEQRVFGLHLQTPFPALDDKQSEVMGLDAAFCDWAT